MALKKVLRRAVLEKSRFDIFKCLEGETGGGVLHVPGPRFFFPTRAPSLEVYRVCRRLVASWRLAERMLFLLGASTLSANPASARTQDSANELALPNTHLSRAQSSREQADRARRLVQERLAERRDSRPTFAKSQATPLTLRHDWRDDGKTLVLPAIERLEQKSARELAQRTMHELYPLQLDRELREQTGPSLRPLERAAEKSARLLERSEPPPDLIPEWNVRPEEPPPELMPQWNVASEGEVGEADAVGHKVHGGTHTAAEQRAETRKRQAAEAAAEKDRLAEEKATSKAQIAEEKAKSKARVMAEKARVAGEAAAEKDRLAKEKQDAKMQEMREKGRVNAEMQRKRAEAKSAAAANARLEAMATAKAVAAEKVRVKARDKEARVRAAAAARARAKAERQGVPGPNDESLLANRDSASEAWSHGGLHDDDSASR